MISSLSPSVRRRLTAVATLVTLVCCLFLLSFGWMFIFQPDSAWLLKTGEYIFLNGKIPTHDIYSWTMPDQPWVIYQWLFEAIMGAFLSVGGLWLAGAATFVFACILLMCVMPMQWLRKGVPVWMTFGMLTLALNEIWFQQRPQLVSYFMLLAFIAVLERYRREGGKKLLWVLPPLMVLWVNLHSFWFMGLLAILCYAATLRAAVRPLWLTLLACCAAIFFNPYGFDIVRYNLLFVSEVTQEIAELMPPFYFHNNEVFLFLAYIVLAWMILVVRHRKVPAAGLLLSLIGTVTALRYARFMPIAIVSTWTYVGCALAQPRANPVFRTPAFSCALLLLSVAFPIAIWCNAVPTQRHAAVLFTAGQIDGIKFLQQHYFPGERLYNDEILGDRLLFFSASPVFIDTRFDMYGKQFHKDWLVAHYGDPGWQEYLQRYRVNAIAISQGDQLKKLLFTNPEWLPVYDDGTLSYWISNTPEHQSLIESWNMTKDRIGRVDISPSARINTLRTRHFWAIHLLAAAGKEQPLADELRAARPFLLLLPGETVDNPKRILSTEEQAQVDRWIENSTKTLILQNKH